MGDATRAVVFYRQAAFPLPPETYSLSPLRLPTPTNDAIGCAAVSCWRGA